MPFINISGELIDTREIPIPFEKSVLKKENCFFETIRVNNYKAIFIEDHLERLWKGMQLSKFNIPRDFNREKVIAEISTLTHSNKHEDARIRLQVSYDDLDGLQYNISSIPLISPPTKQVLKICLYADSFKSIDLYSILKICDRQIYNLAAHKAQATNFDDAIILNSYNRICDSTIANVFLVKDGSLYTPSLTEGCIEGIFRKNLIFQLEQQGISVIEKEITIAALKESDEVFLTNSIRNIMPVKKVDDRNYDSSFTYSIIPALPADMQ